MGEVFTGPRHPTYPKGFLKMQISGLTLGPAKSSRGEEEAKEGRKVRSREGEGLAQGHTANSGRQRRNSELGSS